MSNKKDNITPGQQWEFNSDVASCFANMLERSIPDYQSMRALTYKLGERFIQPDTLIIDVGCSTGLAVEPFVNRYAFQNRFLLIDNAASMVEVSRERFSQFPNVSVKNADVWKCFPVADRASLVLSVLSLQFMPVAYRSRILSGIYDALIPGGAFVFVEKILGENLNGMLNLAYHEMKRENGYSIEQIERKERSLENVLSPLKAEWNENLLQVAGFQKIEIFWRCLNFCGWVAVK